MQVMAHHGVGCHAVVVAEASVIRKTTSGKVQRRACRAAFMAGEFAVVSLLPCRAGQLIASWIASLITPATHDCIPTRQLAWAFHISWYWQSCPRPG